MKSILEKMGYETKKFGSGNHDCYQKEPVCNFEMHRALFGRNQETKIKEYYSDVKNRLIKDNDNAFGYHFSPEDFYNFEANTRDFSHEIQPFLTCVYFTKYYNSS